MNRMRRATIFGPDDHAHHTVMQTLSDALVKQAGEQLRRPANQLTWHTVGFAVFVEASHHMPE